VKSLQILLRLLDRLPWNIIMFLMNHLEGTDHSTELSKAVSQFNFALIQHLPLICSCQNDQFDTHFGVGMPTSRQTLSLQVHTLGVCSPMTDSNMSHLA